VRALVERIGRYRVAAVIVGCALVSEVLRVQAFSPSTAVTVALTLGESSFSPSR
jgi:hypothetical protein